MSEHETSQEQRIMLMMRKTLTHVIRETTPQPGMLHPLPQPVLDDIRDCLVLISARERELAESAGVVSNMKPHFVDEPIKASVVPFDKIGRPLSDSSDD